MDKELIDKAVERHEFYSDLIADYNEQQDILKELTGYLHEATLYAHVLPLEEEAVLCVHGANDDGRHYSCKIIISEIQLLHTESDCFELVKYCRPPGKQNIFAALDGYYD
ncbi:unnamed protein product [Allacma fusca]|uniref:Uncharacterized protein n=1 Tax=Allacma fusca TaxID=39272 RepID=A0A8J2JTW1_9HEXA|nr:unnamed protein product [Allacma fusca]